ncbi:FAD-dependent oxidoreductase [Microbacter sp. GSS18]|nr:FAD-dependent oxidoreductase [Microbacter sp. GSS18]
MGTPAIPGTGQRAGGAVRRSVRPDRLHARPRARAVSATGTRRVAVLGAGITGSCLAVELARRGADVTVIDRRPSPMAEASRFNEGKIHLGYLYGADPTLRTARHVLPGGLAFAPIMSDLLDADLEPHITPADDLYLIDRDSVVAADAVGAHFDAVSALVRQHPDARRYLVDASAARSERLGPAELAAVASSRITAGFRVPERSVDTGWIADRLADRVLADDAVAFVPGVTVSGVDIDDDGGRATVRGDGFAERFDVVVNALWGGRLAVDQDAGLALPPTWTHRVRWSLFARTSAPLDTPSAVVAIGPFGDVKNYDGTSFYLSWYTAGLVAQGFDVALAEPALPVGPARDAFIDEVRAGLETVLPWIGDVIDSAEEIRVGGGHVFAEGVGSLADPRSGLHRRDRYGVARRGPYWSVDTGKYSTAPWTARRLADEIMELR